MDEWGLYVVAFPIGQVRKAIDSRAVARKLDVWGGGWIRSCDGPDGQASMLETDERISCDFSLTQFSPPCVKAVDRPPGD